MISARKVFSLLSLLLFSAFSIAQNVSPLDFGWAKATSDSARFWVLYKTHSAAVERHLSVSYAGLDTLDIEIPSNARSIPVGGKNDFGNAVLRVKNCRKNIFLFTHINATQKIDCSDSSALCWAINTGNYRGIPALDTGTLLLHVVDSNHWVGERQGHAYGHFREELLMLNNGVSRDTPSFPYCDTTSRPRIWIIQKMDKFSFAHLTLIRDSSSTRRTYLLNIENTYHPVFSNIAIFTPKSDLVDDCIFRIYHCYQSWFDSIHIDGSYSRANRSGYGILMNNCTHTYFSRLYARTPWGVFGTNNMNQVRFESCSFDRFDIHCYGRDIEFNNCLQQDSYNQFSSVFGTIRFTKCTFSNFTPVLIESSYNAYNYFALEMTNCSWHLTKSRNYLMDAGRPIHPHPYRTELAQYCLPDIQIDSLSLSSDRNNATLRLFRFWGDAGTDSVYGISHILFNNINRPKRVKLEITDRKHKPIHFVNNINIQTDNWELKN